MFRLLLVSAGVWLGTLPLKQRVLFQIIYAVTVARVTVVTTYGIDVEGPTHTTIGGFSPGSRQLVLLCECEVNPQFWKRGHHENRDKWWIRVCREPTDSSLSQ